MTAFFPATPLKMGSLLILALLAVISFLAIRIIFPDSHGNRDQFHDMPAAEQCLNKFGVHTTMSEPKNQKIHLICVNLDTGDVYQMFRKAPCFSSGDVRNGLDFDFGLHDILLEYDCAKSERS
jgi:hypothetical protein